MWGSRACTWPTIVAAHGGRGGKSDKSAKGVKTYVPGSKLVVLGMVIPPLVGNSHSGYINPYYWIDDHPLLHGNNGSLDPSTYQSGVNNMSPLAI